MDDDVVDLQRRVADLERRMALLEGNAPREGYSALEWGSSARPGGIDAEVQQLALSGNKIEAIKRYRQLTGAGLREAKDAVDRIA